jgi:hypothetical protein
MSAFRHLALAFSVLLCTSPALHAEDTGWIMGSKLWYINEQWEKAHVVPVKIECKDSGKKGAGLDSAFVRVTVEPNTKGFGWYWYGTIDLKGAIREMATKGYRLASSQTFVRQPSGAKLSCAIFHKG